jgi:hypothetical protein
MALISCYVNEEIERWLNQASADLGHTVEELAASAIEAAALRYRLDHLERIEKRARKSP